MSVRQLGAQTIDYVVTDTFNVFSFKSYDDSTEMEYGLKCSNQEKINKKYRLYYDTKKTKLARQFNCDSNGLMDTLKEWFENGQIKQIYYSNRNVDPKLYEYTAYFRNGKLNFTRKCKNDSCLTTIYFKDGKIKEKLYEKGIRLYYQEKYYANGQLMFAPHLIENDKVYYETLYYESGKISQEQYWVNYALVGNFKAFHENGKLKIVGQFETEQEYFSQMKNSYRDAVKIGKWSYYDNTGTLETEEFYELNKLVKTIKY
ncbi:MAG: hypothetical protein V4565_05280 [Bacteroidota bacterium]